MSDATTLFDRALRRLSSAWRDMAASVSGGPDQTLEDQMRDCLRARGGEVSARNRAARLAQTWSGLGEAERLEFLRVLAAFDSDPDSVAAAYATVREAQEGWSNFTQGTPMSTAPELLEELHISHLAGNPSLSLSGGERRR